MKSKLLKTNSWKTSSWNTNSWKSNSWKTNFWMTNFWITNPKRQTLESQTLGRQTLESQTSERQTLKRQTLERKKRKKSSDGYILYASLPPHYWKWAVRFQVKTPKLFLWLFFFKQIHFLRNLRNQEDVQVYNHDLFILSVFFYILKW